MKERIIQIMEAEQLTPSLFADKLNIGRAVISHILNGRNNPSLDVVIRILNTMDYVDADWLLSGKGNMRKSDISEPINGNVMANKNQPSIPSDLFASTDFETASTNVNSIKIDKTEKEDDTHNLREVTSKSEINTERVNTIVNHQVLTEKKISKVIIYYSDNTFQAFNPNNAPL